jgi:hypothetical protein
MKRQILGFCYDVIPPSENELKDIGYRFVNGKRQPFIRYSAVAEKYRKDLTKFLRENCLDEIIAARDRNVHSLFSTEITFIQTEASVLNSTWLAKKNRPKSPYKRNDAQNRDKLLIDIVAEMLDIDDSRYWGTNTVLRLVGDSDCVCFVLYEETDPRSFGIPEGYLRDLPPE